jgi:hypothetical protein
LGVEEVGHTFRRGPGEPSCDAAIAAARQIKL